MKFDRKLLGSVAGAALVGAFCFAAPAHAQYSGNPPQYSTPAERAETQQLNEQNLDGTTQTPAQLNAEPGSAQQGYYGGEPQYGAGAPDNDNGAQNGPPPNGPNDQGAYQQQMQQYQDEHQDYEHQRAQYEDQKDRYRHELSWYDQTRWDYDYPHAYGYEFDEPRLEHISLMNEAPDRLHDVPVEDPHGRWVGRIRNIDIRADGRVARVEVSLNRRVSVWMRPDHLRFDPDERVAYTDLSRHDLWQTTDAQIDDNAGL